MTAIPLFTDEIPAPRTPSQRHTGVRRGSAAGSGRATRTAHVAPPPPASALALVEQARRGLAVAAATDDVAERYASAHVAALRAAAAVVTIRSKPARRGRPAPVWTLLATAAPELQEWAAFFAAGSQTRAAVEAGVTRLVSTDIADDLLLRSREFVDIVERLVRESR